MGPYAHAHTLCSGPQRKHLELLFPLGLPLSRDLSRHCSGLVCVVWLCLTPLSHLRINGYLNLFLDFFLYRNSRFPFLWRYSRLLLPQIDSSWTVDDFRLARGWRSFQYLGRLEALGSPQRRALLLQLVNVSLSVLRWVASSWTLRGGFGDGAGRHIAGSWWHRVCWTIKYVTETKKAQQLSQGENSSVQGDEFSWLRFDATTFAEAENPS